MSDAQEGPVDSPMDLSRPRDGFLSTFTHLVPSLETRAASRGGYGLLQRRKVIPCRRRWKRNRGPSGHLPRRSGMSKCSCECHNGGDRV